MSDASRSIVIANRYLDSVALLRLAADLGQIAGIRAATAVMATPANLARARANGIEAPPDAQPNDLFIGVSGDPEACEAALRMADERMRAPHRAAGGSATAEEPHVSLWQHAAHADADIALVSVPGAFAAAEAAKAIELGMHVMVFSDNVELADEVALKKAADTKGLLVMGPDCGTALVNGVPLGFVNVVRRGRIGIVGASGTGMQEVMARIHGAGAGIAHAIGCGGRDVSDAVGGSTMCRGLGMLAADPHTDVIVIVSKPPAASVLPAVLAAAAHAAKPVVAVFVGMDADVVRWPAGVHSAASLAEAADVALELAGVARPRASTCSSVEARPGGHVIRGGFTGGTFCHEAHAIFERSGLGATSLELIDFGDDAYTDGRPHPMIDPALRDAWIGKALADPTTAMVLLDVVLGLGAHPRPIDGLLDVLAAPSRETPVIAHVCGTELDPQGRGTIVERLRGAGVSVADSNAHACELAAQALVARSGS